LSVSIMGIDRIGKGGMAPPVPPPTVSPTALDRTSSSAGIARSFEPQADAPVEEPSPAEAVAAGPLQQLQSGNLTLERYLDAKVDEATAQLVLPPSDLSAIRAALRERLASDPTLVDLVRSATGAVASPPHDE
jgi:hypothetical protein